jgi:hypothetical protein
VFAVPRSTAMSRPRNVSALLIGNGNLPIRAGDLELSARAASPRRGAVWGSYLDNGDNDDAGSPGSGKRIFPGVGEPAAGC